MLVLAMEFSRVAQARERRSLSTEQEQPDAPRRDRHAGTPRAEAQGPRPAPVSEGRRIASDRLGITTPLHGLRRSRVGRDSLERR